MYSQNPDVYLFVPVVIRSVAFTTSKQFTYIQPGEIGFGAQPEVSAF